MRSFNLPLVANSSLGDYKAILFVRLLLSKHFPLLLGIKFHTAIAPYHGKHSAHNIQNPVE